MRVLGLLAIGFTLLASDARAQQPCTTANRCRTVLASLGANTFGRNTEVVTDGRAVYFATAAGVRVPTSGGPATNMANQPVRSFVINRTNLYWVDTDTIHARPLGGGATTTLTRVNANYVNSLMVTHAMLFWIADFQDIQSMPITGGAITNVVHLATPTTPGPLGPMGPLRRIATDGTYLYFTAKDEVKRTQLAGGPVSTLVNVATLLNPNLGGLGGTVSDLKADSSNVYVAMDFGELFSISSSGTPTKIATVPDVFYTVVLSGSTLYWPERRNGVINSIGTSGGHTMTYSAGTASPVGVTVDATSLYYLTESGDVVKVSPK